MGPFDVVDLESFTLAGSGVVSCIVDNSSTEIGLFCTLGILDPDGLQDFASCKNCVGPLAVDVDGGNLKAGFMACILRRA